MMRAGLLSMGIAALLLAAASASFAAGDDQPGKHDTAKGAAAGALVGHEVGKGHAVAGAAAGAAVGHHMKKKAQSGNNG